MASDKLTDTAIRKAVPGEKVRRLADGGGMYLELHPNGGRYWRMKYRIAGREKRLALGVYPDVSLADARHRRDEARRLVAAGTDPGAARKVEKATQALAAEAVRLAVAGKPAPGTFEAVANEWFSIRRGDWSASYGDKVLSRLVGAVFPFIGAKPVGDVTPPELLAVLRRIEARGTIETAHRARESCSQVFRFAIGAGLAQSDPARDLAGLLQKPRVVHFAAIADPARFGELLRAVEGYRGTPVVRAALKLAALVFLRPGSELRSARWDEFDLEAAVWTVPSERMKRNKHGKEYGDDHIVPLSTQAVAILRELQPLTGNGPVVFRGERGADRPISDNTMNAALDALGFTRTEHRAHGFRASARTMLDERLGVDVKVIDAQQDHAVTDANGTAYNRTKFLEQRRTMMQTWADYLDTLRDGARVLPFKTRAG